MRFFFALLGLLSLALGIVGIFLPVLPTTPFVLLSAFLFAKSSPRLHFWLVNHPRFGHLIKNWEERRAIPKYAKIMSSSMMAFSIGMAFYRLQNTSLWWLSWCCFALCLAVSVWIWSLPHE